MRYWFGVPPVLWAYVVCAVLIGSVAAIQNVFGLNKSEWAGWVQAIGSILAVVGAWLGIRYQLERSEQKRVEAILAVAEAGIERVELVARLMDEQDPQIALVRDFHQAMLDGILIAFKGVPVHELQSGRGVIAFMGLQDQLGFIGRAISACIAGPDEHPLYEKSLRAALDSQGVDAWHELRRRYETVLADNVGTHVKASRANYRALLQAAGR